MENNAAEKSMKRHTFKSSSITSSIVMMPMTSPCCLKEETGFSITLRTSGKNLSDHLLLLEDSARDTFPLPEMDLNLKPKPNKNTNEWSHGCTDHQTVACADRLRYYLLRVYSIRIKRCSEGGIRYRKVANKAMRDSEHIPMEMTLFFIKDDD
ncbi:hypothetical protein Ccrd_025021 [Cynara cardunculus var. scolymus]|uniref:Uncharacterized protein n=1 Tax=Cynara cardunculus var. scolymus TaxID=59895 RepID=A0A103XBJ1_CYNCS|nr:hypothetical protein Ccrd_025021 [Cynara cardunculus var. scolymus]